VKCAAGPDADKVVVSSLLHQIGLNQQQNGDIDMPTPKQLLGGLMKLPFPDHDDPERVEYLRETAKYEVLMFHFLKCVSSVKDFNRS